MTQVIDFMGKKAGRKKAGKKVEGNVEKGKKKAGKKVEGKVRKTVGFLN